MIKGATPLQDPLWSTALFISIWKSTNSEISVSSLFEKPNSHFAWFHHWLEQTAASALQTLVKSGEVSDSRQKECLAGFHNQKEYQANRIQGFCLVERISGFSMDKGWEKGLDLLELGSSENPRLVGLARLQAYIEMQSTCERGKIFKPIFS